MTLSWQNVPLYFAQGLDTKSHPYQVPMGKLTQLENCVFTQTGSMNKRAGYSILDNNVFNDVNTISGAVATATYNDDLLIFDNNNVFSWVPALNKWGKRGSCTALESNTNSIIANSYTQSASDMLVSRGLQLVAWNDSRGGIRYSLIDDETKSQLITDAALATAGISPLCIAFGDYLLIGFATNDGRIQVAIVVPETPSLVSIVTLTPDVHLTYTKFDMYVKNDLLYVAYVSSITNGVTISSFDSLFVQQATHNFAEPTTRAITIFPGDHDDFWLGYGTDDEALYSNISDDLATVHTNEDLLQADIKIDFITGVIDGYGQASFAFDSTDGVTRPYINYATVDTTQVIEAGPFLQGVSLYSKAFTYNNRFYFFTNLYSPLQSTYFLVNSLAEVVSKSQDSVAGGPRSGTNLANVNNPNTGEYWISTERQVTLNQNTGISADQLLFTSSYKTALLSNTLHITGGILQAYDGNQVVEHGFNYFPESIEATSAFGGFLSAGTYSYQFTYQWTDNTGKIEESAPSPPVSVTFAADNGQVGFIIPTLTLTKKTGVRIVVYRTRSSNTGDPILRRISSLTSPLYNDPTTGFVAYIDTASDESIATNGALYCTVDTNDKPVALENISAPTCNIITVYKNRVFIAGLEDPNEIWYSKTVVPGECAGFNDVLKTNLSPIGGDIVALSVLDSNLIIFKKNSIFIMSGLGPTNTGDDNDFQDPQQLGSDVGCIAASSIGLVSSQGLFFQSTKGIYKLDRNGTTTYVGAPAEGFNDQTIVATVAVPDTTQVRFLCNDGSTIVYDYQFDQWGTFTNHLAVGAGVWLQTFYFLSEDGKIHLQNESFLDGTVPINMSMTTGWISFAGLQNYERLRYFLFLGSFKGHHQLKVSIAYDGNESFVHTVVIDTNDLFDVHTFGEQNPYGENSPFGGEFSDEQFKIFIKYPRIQKIKIKLEEINTSDNGGLSFVGLNCAIGVKAGMGKVKQTHNFGVE